MICSSKPLHIVQESQKNPLFNRIRELHAAGSLIYEPVWYWCALNSLTARDSPKIGNLSLISDHQQKQMLTLYTPDVCGVSEAVLEICGEDISDPAKVEQLLQVWKYNCFEFSDHPLGFSLYFLPSFLSHACNPNAIWSIENSDLFVLRARKEISDHQEICISYLPEEHLARPRDERRKVLMATKNFQCNCPRCEQEISDHSPVSSPRKTAYRRLRRILEKLETSEDEDKEISDQTVSDVQELPDSHWQIGRAHV